MKLEQGIEIALRQRAKQMRVERAVFELFSVAPNEQYEVVVRHANEFGGVNARPRHPIKWLRPLVLDHLLELWRAGQRFAHLLMSSKILWKQGGLSSI
ncbi:hypothetical protein [Caballeronia sp. GAWG2-1]|uniref:hypothetical protein n=1 Tax=Caballeronia sp. GAWG2-1 TaxID=2921744 RepID=UPI0020283D81|nr:hypothetical protein [Caballeronia sp. GAWG2-1]